MLFRRTITRLTTITTLLPHTLATPQLPNLFGIIGQLLGSIPILSSPPPAFLMTKIPPPACGVVNQGSLLCCESTFDSDLPLVAYLSPQAAIKLNKNSIDCTYGVFKLVSLAQINRFKYADLCVFKESGRAILVATQVPSRLPGRCSRRY